MPTAIPSLLQEVKLLVGSLSPAGLSQRPLPSIDPLKLLVRSSCDSLAPGESLPPAILEDSKQETAGTVPRDGQPSQTGSEPHTAFFSVGCSHRPVPLHLSPPRSIGIDRGTPGLDRSRRSFCSCGTGAPSSMRMQWNGGSVYTDKLRNLTA